MWTAFKTRVTLLCTTSSLSIRIPIMASYKFIDSLYKISKPEVLKTAHVTMNVHLGMWTPFRIPVTTRILTSLGNLHLPLASRTDNVYIKNILTPNSRDVDENSWDNSVHNKWGEKGKKTYWHDLYTYTLGQSRWNNSQRLDDFSWVMMRNSYNISPISVS